MMARWMGKTFPNRKHYIKMFDIWEQYCYTVEGVRNWRSESLEPYPGFRQENDRMARSGMVRNSWN